MTSKQDYYDLLSVSRNASLDEIRKAFRTLARKHHPDVNGGDREAEEKFKDIKEAYDVLSDPEKRRYYDQFGHAGPGVGSAEGQGFGVDLFDLFFGGGRRPSQRNAPQEGSDLRYDLEITLEDAAAGIDKTITIERERSCATCSGTGSRAGVSAASCSSCQGSGQVRRTQQTMLGSFSTVVTCPRCGGEGTIITDPCPDCRGSGRERAQADLKVRIPPGVDTGNRIQMAREGDGGIRGGPSGDLYIFIKVAPHDRFERQRNDLVTELSVSFAQVALGAVLQAPTLTGTTELRLPAGTQSGQVFRLRGFGMPEVGGRVQGDLHVVIRVSVPEKMNDRQRKAVEDLAIAFGEGTEEEHHGLRGLFEKAKEVFDFDK
jgi:molecular chaperone DnaJ